MGHDRAQLGMNLAPHLLMTVKSGDIFKTKSHVALWNFTLDDLQFTISAGEFIMIVGPLVPDLDHWWQVACWGRLGIISKLILTTYCDKIS